MSDFHRGGPPMGFGVPGGMPLEVESRFMYNGIGGGSTNVTKHRLDIDIYEAREIDSSHFMARLDTGYKWHNTKSNIRLVNKNLRRYQIQKIILENMNQSSIVRAYGDAVQVRCNLTTEDIIEKLNRNKDVRVGEIGFFENLINKLDDFTEKLFIARYKTKAMLNYGKGTKRERALQSINHEIDYRESLLNGYLLHNYNIYSIHLGKIKRNNGFRGMMPDDGDKAIIVKRSTTPIEQQNVQTSQNSVVSTSQNTVTQPSQNQVIQPTQSQVIQPAQSPVVQPSHRSSVQGPICNVDFNLGGSNDYDIGGYRSVDITPVYSWNSLGDICSDGFLSDGEKSNTETNGRRK